MLDAVGEVERAALVARMRPRSYKRGQAVFNDGDVGDCLHFVQLGRFEVHAATLTGQTMMLRVAHPGEFFGELALVHPERHRTGRVCALESAHTLALYRTDFDDVRHRHPEVDRVLVAVLAERVIRTSELVMELLLPPEARVWRRLAVFVEAYGDEPIRMSQDDLAHAAGTVRQTVNRTLRHGVAQGVLKLERSAIHVLDREALDQLASCR